MVSNVFNQVLFLECRYLSDFCAQNLYLNIQRADYSTWIRQSSCFELGILRLSNYHKLEFDSSAPIIAGKISFPLPKLATLLEQINFERNRGSFFTDGIVVGIFKLNLFSSTGFMHWFMAADQPSMAVPRPLEKRGQISTFPQFSTINQSQSNQSPP